MKQKCISLCIFASALALMTASADDSLYVSHVHRGGGKYERPDNTLETFKWCWENGSALECDCRKTKDGVGVMLHDDNLLRNSWGDTLATLRNLSKFRCFCPVILF